MRALLAILFLSCLTCFGQFGIEQPFFLKSSGLCLDLPTPYDTFTDYTNHVSLNGLDYGCWWNGAYVLKSYENIPAVWHQDIFSSYTDGDNLAGLNGGIAWYSTYVAHTYEDFPYLRYVDAMDEYADADSMITDTLSGGTNYFFLPLTNSPAITQAWTNGPYVGKGY